jgi:hypothetical protein
MVCSLFSARFQAVFGSFANPDRRVPVGDTHARERDGASMGPILRHVFEPNPTPFCEVPVKLPSFPDKRQFGMGPVLGSRFLPTTSRSRRYGVTLAPSPVGRVFGESHSQSAWPLKVRPRSVFCL